MIKDGKVVNLAAWKKRREEKELEELRTRVEALVEELDLENDPMLFPTHFSDPSMGMVNWFPPELEHGYGETGMTTHADIVLERNINSCSKTLAWVAFILSDMGLTDESNTLEELIRHLDSIDA